MSKQSVLSEARSTCDGLHKLIRNISEAAVDIDNSSYELLALIASANTCVINLSTQLTILETTDAEDSNVLPIKRQDSSEQTEDKISAAR